MYVSALRLDDGELLIIIAADATQRIRAVAARRLEGFCPRSAISDYAQRWGIETLFGIFKTRGFCLESTHFTDAQRLSKLLALMAIALCWAIKTGEWLHQHQPMQHAKRASVARTNASHSSLAKQDDGANAPYSALCAVQPSLQEALR